ncbi:MAG: peptide ABC transporter substrate-binding protein [Chitinivibrionales bacterium]|nr:peptide ABC transporter substrate-binding protein [Chitinivibrionales bacterium]
MAPMLKSTFAAMIGVALALALSGCQQKKEAENPGRILRYGNQIEPQDLDPHIITGIPEYHIVSGLLEGLVNPDPVDLHPLPGMAEAWDISADRCTYTFHLRPAALWSSGDTVTAADFVFSIRRILSPRLGAEYAYMLYCVKNGRRFNKGELTDFSQVGVRAPDARTLVITLTQPTPYFLALLSHHSWFPVHPKTILKFGPLDARGTAWTRPENFVGNGPFTLAKWELNKIIEIRKNPRYWDAAAVRLQAVRFYPIENMQTEERAFRTGQLDLTTNVPLEKIDWYKQHDPQLLKIDPYLGTYYYLFNVNKPPLNDKRVRRALALAVDRESLVKYVLKGGQAPAICFTPPNTAGYTSAATIGFDTLEARRLLAEAGYNAQHPLPAISLLYNTLQTHHEVAQALQQMWRTYLGVSVTLVNQEWKVYLASTQERSYDIARMGWIGDYNDPNTFLDMWITGGGNNRTGWSNRAYDSLIAAAAAASSQQERYRCFSRAETILLDEMPVLPIYFYTNGYLMQPQVKGWYPNILNLHPYKFMWIEKK